LCEKTGISSTTLSLAITDLLDAGYIYREKNFVNTQVRPSFAYVITSEGHEYLKSKMLSQSRVTDAARHIEKLRFCPDPSRPHNQKKLPISARLLLTFFISRQIANGLSAPFSQSEIKHLLKMSSGKYKAALNLLLSSKVINWYIPGFKSGILIGNEKSLVRLNRSFSVADKNSSIISVNIINVKSTLDLVDGLFNRISFSHWGIPMSKASYATPTDQVLHLVAHDYRRAPQIAEHIKLELIFLVEEFALQHLNDDISKRSAALLRYLAPSENLPEGRQGGYQYLVDELLRISYKLHEKVYSAVMEGGKYLGDRHDIQLEVYDPALKEIAILVIPKNSGPSLQRLI